MLEKGKIQETQNVDTYINLSFIIPTYNEEKLLPKVLFAIKKHLVGLVYEIIVVDNGSNDATIQIAREFSAAVLVDSSKTIAGLRNLGASNASGRALVFLDGDVIITQEWAENILNVISSIEHNNQVIMGSRCGISAKPSWIEKYWFAPMAKEKANYINSGHLIIDKEVFHEIGGFDDNLITGEDWEFCIRAKKKGIVIVNNSGLRVIHEGYPKTLRQFVRREKWHGIQDAYHIISFLKSKPAILASIYWFSGILGIASSVYYKSVIYIVMAVIINSIICMLATFYRRKQFPLNVGYYFLLYHVYFFARGLAVLAGLFQKHSRETR